jgi:hypothetical protein
VQRACKSVALAGKVHRIHQLNVAFNSPEPRLNNTGKIPKLTLKLQVNPALNLKINVVARRIVTSLFYFKLNKDALLQ